VSQQTGAGCPVDGIPVFSNIFQQGTISVRRTMHCRRASKRFSHGLQFNAAYTYGKSLDYASRLRVWLNPFKPRRGEHRRCSTRRHRFVFSYYWDLPVPKYQGFKEKLLNGLVALRHHHAQSGFPSEITQRTT